jgi:hypothetical protein
MRIAIAGAFLLLSAGVGWPGPVAAPQRERAHAFVMMRLIEVLQLPDDQAIALASTLRRADQRRAELGARRDAVDTDLRAALARTPPDVAELERLIAAVVAVERQLSAIPQETFAEITTLLDAERQAQFLLEMRALRDTVRERLRGRLRENP